MLKVQATACGSDTTSASARRLAISARILSSFAFGRFAGEAQIVQHHRAERRRRPVGPDRVDRIGLDRNERRAGIGAGARQPFRALGGVQPGVVAELGARRQVLLEPALRAGVGDRHDREHRCVDLGLRRERVAAIDEQRGLVGEHHRRPGGAGEAGQPGQPLLGGRHVFVLVPVGARQDQAGQPAAAPIPRAAPAREARFAPVADRQTTGNGPRTCAANLWAGAGPGNCAANGFLRTLDFMCVAT